MSELLPDWESPVLHLTSSESTQDLARKMAEEGSPEWTLIIADRQTHGRGRLGRKWGSTQGGLYLSLILRPEVPPTALAHLSLTAASSVAKALSEISRLHTAVKSPNDVLAAPATDQPVPAASSLKKICGILAEASGSSTRTEWVALGIGINVNNKLPKSLQKKAGSLAELAGREFEIPEILRAILGEFRKQYALFLNTYRRGLS